MSALPPETAAAPTAPASAPVAPPRRRRFLRWVLPILVVLIAAGWAVAGPLPASWRVAVTVERISEPGGPEFSSAERVPEVAGMSTINRRASSFQIRPDLPTREVVIRVRPRFGRALPSYDFLNVVWERLDGTPVVLRVTGSVEGQKRISEADLRATTLGRLQQQVAAGVRKVRQVVWPVKSGEDFPGRYRASELVIVQRVQVQPGFQDARVRVRFVGTARTGPTPAVPPQPPLTSKGDRVIAEVWSAPFRLLERPVPPPKPKPAAP